MSNDEPPGKAIRTFFESPENKNLFIGCPLRRHLSHLSELDAVAVDNILAHMLGHIIDYKAGEPRRDETNQITSAINQDDIQDELRYVYNDCNNARLNKERSTNPALDPYGEPEYQGFGPEQRGCSGDDARAELMAEAIRAYMQNPNYLKKAAPKVAARIRAAVNPNPNLNKIIQFN